MVPVAVRSIPNNPRRQDPTGKSDPDYMLAGSPGRGLRQSADWRLGQICGAAEAGQIMVYMFACL